MRPLTALTLPILLLAAALPAGAQWTNRYAEVPSYGHQVYLEGYELPILNAGPMDPAPSPDGMQIAFSSRGWIWTLDLETRVARRRTSSGGIDARPSWSSDSRRIVFVRDLGRQLQIVSFDLDDGEERVLVDTEAIHLDPVFSPGGQTVVYSSSEEGEIGLWSVDLESLERRRLSGPGAGVTPRRFIDRRPQLAGPERIVLLNKQGGRDSVQLLDLGTGDRTTLIEDWLVSQGDLSLSPDRKVVAATWPADGTHEIRLFTLAEPSTSVLLTSSQGMPLAPAFSHDGTFVYFAEANDDERMELQRIPTVGGRVETVAIERFDWGAPTGRLQIRTTVGEVATAVRMTARDAAGHPLVPDRGAVRNEAQSDRVFFYSDGTIELTVPAGEVTVGAVHGFETPLAEQRIAVAAGETATLDLELERVWDAGAAGWYAGDNHFHLNYGGPYRLEPEDLTLDLEGEGMDIGWPLLANLHNRFNEQDLLRWRRSEPPLIAFGQEVRSHFLGHLNVLGTEELFWPWIWGPGYQVYGSDDRTNAEVLQFARGQRALGGYVHPVTPDDPFAPGRMRSIPLGFVADAVLGQVDLIEVECLWTSGLGTAALWHEVLNLGIPLAPSAGSDVMSDYYRTMAPGATRVYVRPEGPLSVESYLEALGSGRSFVTNGPLLDFRVAGERPGGAVAGAKVDWQLEVYSALPFESVELFVNGTVVQSFAGGPAGQRSYRGSVEVPSGGWITARATGANPGWPALDSTLFAETAPVWFGAIGSSEPSARRASAQRLLQALDTARTALDLGYGDAEIPKLHSHFDAARAKLVTLASP
ncbi:MAG: CehA/McbA family metallohydrolase [Acidobacteriota bacterium]